MMHSMFAACLEHVKCSLQQRLAAVQFMIFSVFHEFDDNLNTVQIVGLVDTTQPVYQVSSRDQSLYTW